MKNNNKHTILFLILAIFFFIEGFYINKIILKKSFISNKNHKSATDKIEEITLTPYFINSSFKNNTTFFPESLDYSVVMGLMSNSEDIDFNNIEMNLNKLNPNILTTSKKNKEALDKINGFKKVHTSTENNIKEVNIENNNLAFIYIDDSIINNLFQFNNTLNIINNYKNEGYAVIIFLDSDSKGKKQLESLKGISKSGALLIFTNLYKGYHLERLNDSFIIYNTINNNNLYFPQFDIVYNESGPISVGIKIFINDINNRKSILEEINEYSLGFTKKLQENYCFFDV